MIRATSVEELEPFLTMCRNGQLFDVQAWIRQASRSLCRRTLRPRRRSTTPSVSPSKAAFTAWCRSSSRLAPPCAKGSTLLEHAVELRRRDLVLLLLEAGANVTHVSMRVKSEGSDRYAGGPTRRSGLIILPFR